jgi:N-acetyl sugar amidotransferase
MYQICTICVMDVSATEITFDIDGVCSFCSSFKAKYGDSFSVNNNSINDDSILKEFLQAIKLDGEGKPYDCVIGVSGGLDSSWVLVKAIELGLRPLAVHMDNGWNSEIAVSNISCLIEELNVDLFTHVIKWQEYKALMQAFFDANVIDVELLYDNALTAVCYNKAKEYKLKYILSGSNTATEGIAMPSSWAHHDKWDGTNIRAIARTNNVKIETFPIFTNFAWLQHTYLAKRVWIPFLDFFIYDKSEALKVLEADYGYKRYPYKHYESVFTRFFQGVILPDKFSVDKRRVHLSSLIVTQQMTREEALEDLNGIPYPTKRELDADLEYFLKKMEWTREDFDKYISRGRVEHDAYREDLLRKFFWPTASKLRKRYIKFRSFI